MTWRIEMLQHTHEYVQNQIALGDAKTAGILAWDAALVAWLAGEVTHRSVFELLMLLLYLTALCLILSVVFCAFALAPSTPKAGSRNRISFVETACCSLKDYSEDMLAASQAECEREICEHIHLLAGIAKRKFGLIRVSVALSAAASACLILSLLL